MTVTHSLWSGSRTCPAWPNKSLRKAAAKSGKGKGKGKGKGLDVTPTIDANRKAFDKWAQKVLKGSKIITEGTSNVTEDLEWALIAARDFSAAWDETPVEILERQRTVLKSYIDEASDGGKIITEDIRKQIAAYNELGEKIDAIPEKIGRASCRERV